MVYDVSAVEVTTKMSHDLQRGFGIGTLSSTLASCSLCLVGTSEEHIATLTERCAELPIELCGPLALGLLVRAYFLCYAR